MIRDHEIGTCTAWAIDPVARTQWSGVKCRCGNFFHPISHTKKKPPLRAACESGAGNRNRTYDLRITNAPLYQLSYSGDAKGGHSSREPASLQLSGSQQPAIGEDARPSLRWRLNPPPAGSAAPWAGRTPCPPARRAVRAGRHWRRAPSGGPARPAPARPGRRRLR